MVAHGEYMRNFRKHQKLRALRRSSVSKTISAIAYSGAEEGGSVLKVSNILDLMNV